MASYMLNALTLRHDHDAAERTLHHFWDTKDLLDSSLIEEHIASQPLLAASLFCLISCSFGLIVFAIVFLTCRFRGQCGSQKYQEYPSNSTNYAIYLMLFFISWLIVTAASAYFILAGIGFWSERLDARKPFSNASSLVNFPSEEEIRNRVEESSGVPGRIAEIFGNEEEEGAGSEEEDPGSLVVTGETMTVEEDSEEEEEDTVILETTVIPATSTTVPTVPPVTSPPTTVPTTTTVPSTTTVPPTTSTTVLPTTVPPTTSSDILDQLLSHAESTADFPYQDTTANPHLPYFSLHSRFLIFICRLTFCLVSLCLLTLVLPTFFLVVAGTGCYIYSDHPMNRSSVSNKNIFTVDQWPTVLGVNAADPQTTSLTNQFFPTLFVGESPFGLYAIEALVDHQTITYSPKLLGPPLLEGAAPIALTDLEREEYLPPRRPIIRDIPPSITHKTSDGEFLLLGKFLEDDQNPRIIRIHFSWILRFLESLESLESLYSEFQDPWKSSDSYFLNFLIHGSLGFQDIQNPPEF
uniref:Protein kinase domain-containing protein n=1 Tax=Caenorhabditis tropicalis TaxID=1561998 RepID=A0A1I7UR28_9PELO